MKTLLKAVIRLLALVAVSPILAAYYCHRIVAQQNAFAGWSQFLSLIPGKTGVYCRHAFFRHSLKQCDLDAHVGFGTILSSSETLIGKTVYIGNYCSLGKVTLEDDVLIASHVSIMNGTGQHSIQRLDIPVREQPGEFPMVTIGQDTWIGERATIAANVGRHCVIGTGAVVLSEIPDYAIAVGCPAKIVGDRRKLAAQSSEKHEVPKQKPVLMV